MLFKKTFILLFYFTSLLYQTAYSQNIPIGNWQGHLPYSNATSVTEGNNIVYCATSSAVFTFNKEDNSLEKLDPVNGLSDLGVSKIKFNPQTNNVIIAYSNGNIDIIKEDNSIVNLSFIKNSNVVGSKSINHIFLKGKLAYLSTGFGIVVLDTEKLEIVDTYLFGPLGTFVITNAVTFDNQNIYAATNQGIFYANKNSANLTDYNSWSLLPDLGTSHFSNIVFYNNLLFTSSESPTWLRDSLYYNNNGTWQKFLPNGQNIVDMVISNGKLIISNYGQIDQYNSLFTIDKSIYLHQGQYNLRPQGAILDSKDFLWIADEEYGLLKAKDNWNGEIITPNSPSSNGCFALDFVNDNLWSVSGGLGIDLKTNIMNHKKNGEWVNFSKKLAIPNSTFAEDLVSVAINPSNPDNVYLGSWEHGLLEINNNKLSQTYTGRNSVLDSVFYGNTTSIGAIKFDNDNNLWATSSFSATYNILAVKTPGNSWYSFTFPGKFTNLNYFTELVIDKNNYKWIPIQKGNSILVFDDNGTLDDTSDDQSIKLSSGTNGIPGFELISITEDLDGEIWLGTDEGIAVIYNASSVFEETIKAERIYIQQDGHTQKLLESERVTCIAIDGANRKWIGTHSSGVYLMNEDGTEEVFHFTEENSPLFSNNIQDITIDNKTGDVFFGTSKGIISYRSTATETHDDFSNVFVYPNPVKHNYSGTIAIRGLVKDSDVRITDISGNIVYKTTSLGGQAIWDGNDFNGNRVQTGVYLFFLGNEDGEKKHAAKILFIN